MLADKGGRTGDLLCFEKIGHYTKGIKKICAHLRSVVARRYELVTRYSRPNPSAVLTN